MGLEIDRVKGRFDFERILLDIYYLSLLLIVATIPFSIQVNTLTTTFSVICWFTLLVNPLYQRRLIKSLKSNVTAILFILYALATAMSVFIHFGSYEEFNTVLKTIERRTIFLFVPLVLSGLVLLPDLRIKRLMVLYTQVIIVALILCLAIGLYTTLKNGTVVHIDPLNGVVENNFMYHRLGSYIDMHAVFFSSQVCFVFCIQFIRFLHERQDLTLKKRWLYYLQLLFLAGTILLLQSVTISITLLLLILLILLHKVFYTNKSRRFARVALLIIVLTGIGSGISISGKLSKGNKLLDYNLSDIPGPHWNAVNIRLAIWEVNLKAIKEHWLIGVGPSNMDKALETYYRKYNFQFGINDKLNPHNQFLHTLLNLGIIGFLIITALIVSTTRKAVRSKDLILGSLVIIFFLFSMTASTLSVNKGIVFFTFFLTLLTYLDGSAMNYLLKKRDSTA